MKTYAAIGHWVGGGKEDITSVACLDTTKKNFRENLACNNFVPYIIITEEIMQRFRECNDGLDIFNQVKKMTPNYRVWNIVTDYIDECMDILERKIADVRN